MWASDSAEDEGHGLEPADGGGPAGDLAGERAAAGARRGRARDRWIERASGNRLRKGKILLDLSTAPVVAESFSVEAVGQVVDRARVGRDELAGIEIGTEPVPDVGDGPGAWAVR